VTTLGNAVESLEERLFVGRGEILADFQNWLNGARHANRSIWSVTGPAGIGKSTLLRRMRAAATTLGGLSLLVSMTDAGPSAEAIAGALGYASLGTLVAALDGRRAVLFIDDFDPSGAALRSLRDEFMPRLPDSARVVVSSRARLTHRSWRQWQAATVAVPLEPFTDDEATEYLGRRGIVDGREVDAALSVASGLPLLLSLAADTLDRGTSARRLSGDTWTSAIRTLLGDLFAEAGASFTSLVEAAAVLPHFDRGALEMVLGQEIPIPDFEALIQLSFVSHGPAGHAIHHAVRNVVIADLRARSAETYERYAARVAADDLLAGLDNAAVDSALVGWRSESQPATRSQRNVPERGELLRVLAEFLSIPPAMTMTRDERSAQVLARLLEMPNVEFVQARGTDGLMHGYGFFMPIALDTLRALPARSQISAVATRWHESNAVSIPPTADAARVTFASTIVFDLAEPDVTVNTMVKQGFARWMRGGVFLAATAADPYEALLENAGGHRIADLGASVRGGPPLRGWVLDINEYGPDEWRDAVMDGRKPVARLRGRALEAGIHSVLRAWNDDDVLAASPLAALAGGGGASAVRSLITDVLDADASPQAREALDAVRHAYVDRRASVEAAAERLHVSRSTLFRLLRRGVKDIALRLEERPSTD
jgi:hypothetical protein